MTPVTAEPQNRSEMASPHFSPSCSSVLNNARARCDGQSGCFVMGCSGAFSSTVQAPEPDPLIKPSRDHNGPEMNGRGGPPPPPLPPEPAGERLMAAAPIARVFISRDLRHHVHRQQWRWPHPPAPGGLQRWCQRDLQNPPPASPYACSTHPPCCCYSQLQKRPHDNDGLVVADRDEHQHARRRSTHSTATPFIHGIGLPEGELPLSLLMPSAVCDDAALHVVLCACDE